MTIKPQEPDLQTEMYCATPYFLKIFKFIDCQGY